MASRVEKILKGDEIPNPHSRMETYLVAMMTGDKTDSLPTPRSRVGTLLKQVAESGLGGESIPEYNGEVEVSE